MKLQHDTHYLTKSLDVRYVVKDSESSNFLSKHSLNNPNNIDNTEEVSEYGISYNLKSINKDIILDSALLSIDGDCEDFIILQNFEFISYYLDDFIKTAKDINGDFTFLSDNNTKQGCIKVKASGTDDIEEFPILALTTDGSCTIKQKLDNLIRCVQ